MLLSYEEIEPTATRMQARTGVRQANKAKLDAGRMLEVDSPLRIYERIERLRSQGADLPPGTSPEIALERVIGKSDLLPISYLSRGAQVARTVGRIELRSHSGQTIGYGSAFLVAPRLVLTNFHVLPQAADASTARIDFDYADGADGRRLPLITLDLDPTSFFEADRTLDFALCAVKDPAGRLSGLGWNPLIAAPGKAIIGEYVSIIQHPQGEPKQIAFRENQIIDLLPDFLHYATDTSPGSSGSPVYNDAWEVVALHHMGVPRMDGDGNYLQKDGSVWKSGTDDSLIEWVANEGTRISRLVEFLKNARIDGTKRKLMDGMFDASRSNTVPESQVALDAGLSMGGRMQKPVNKDGWASWTIPIEIRVRVPAQLAASGTVDSQTSDPTAGGGGTAGASLVDTSEAVSIDPDYANRQGYDVDFLGSGAKRVPLPRLSAAMKAKAARNRQAKAGSDPHVLPYHHYSVVFNGARKVAFFTAVNIDGESTKKIVRENDVWFFDPRVDRALQAGNDLYKNNPLDRGHLVRRLDPAWGASLAVAKAANDDTFHFTNCSPQHHDFNAGKSLWAGVEDYILLNAKKESKRVTVFTGPILTSRDPLYREIRLPLSFWKVVTIARDTGALAATAYLLSQKSLLVDLDEEFTFGAYKTFQVAIGRVEQLTGLSFGDLKNVDPLNVKSGREATEATSASDLRELGSFTDIELDGGAES